MGDTKDMTTTEHTREQATTMAALRSLASTARQKFSGGQRMTVRKSAVVHAVSMQRWVGGENIPQPLCHTGIYGWDLDAMHPTGAPPTCLRCRRQLADPMEIVLPRGEYQPPLFTIPTQRIAA